MLRSALKFSCSAKWGHLRLFCLFLISPKTLLQPGGAPACTHMHTSRQLLTISTEETPSLSGPSARTAQQCSLMVWGTSSAAVCSHPGTGSFPSYSASAAMSVTNSLASSLPFVFCCFQIFQWDLSDVQHAMHKTNVHFARRHFSSAFWEGCCLSWMVLFPLQSR